MARSVDGLFVVVELSADQSVLHPLVGRSLGRYRRAALFSHVEAGEEAKAQNFMRGGRWVRCRAEDYAAGDLKEA
jgi:hypothetical protein